MLAAVMWLVVVVVFVGRGCAGVDGYGRGVGGVAVCQRPHSVFTRTSAGLAKEPRSLAAT